MPWREEEVVGEELLLWAVGAEEGIIRPEPGADEMKGVGETTGVEEIIEGAGTTGVEEMTEDDMMIDVAVEGRITEIVQGITGIKMITKVAAGTGMKGIAVLEAETTIEVVETGTTVRGVRVLGVGTNIVKMIVMAEMIEMITGMETTEEGVVVPVVGVEIIKTTDGDLKDCFLSQSRF